jgi:hypothetical protein
MPIPSACPTASHLTGNKVSPVTYVSRCRATKKMYHGFCRQSYLENAIDINIQSEKVMERSTISFVAVRHNIQQQPQCAVSSPSPSQDLSNTMTAAVATIAFPLQIPGPSGEARKRRREILASQRSQAMDVELKVSSQVPPEVDVPPEIEVPAKRQKTEGKGNASAKKPQMKYDPDVPMTKEEATTWRREQRRKRNRESAAASRQRQRDRITELEVEVDDWKSKYDSMMASIKKLEEASGKTGNDLMPVQSQPLPETYSKYVSPPTSPGHSPTYDTIASPIASSSLLTSVTQVTPKEEFVNQMVVEAEQHEHSDNLISRPAVS